MIIINNFLRYFVSVALALFFFIPIFPQNKVVENLLEELDNIPEIDKSNIYNKLARAYRDTNLNDFGKILYYGEKALITSEKYHQTDQKCLALSHVCVYYSRSGNFKKAVEYGNKCLYVAETSNKPNNVIVSLLAFAEIYLENNDMKNANIHLKRIIPLYDEIGDKNNVALYSLVVGNHCYYLGEMFDALRFYNKAYNAYNITEMDLKK